MNHRWISRRHAAVVLAGVFLVNSGLGVTPATADPPIKQSALPSITQNWDKILPSGQRFTVLTEFNNQAVRDNETGLVWERAPLATGFTWFQAVGHCAESTVGGRMGWHLPMVEQMTSLLDPGVTSSPKLSPGHPFQISGASNCCWAATQSPDNPALAYTVDISIAGAAAGVKTGALFTWCVRGGQSLNGN